MIIVSARLRAAADMAGEMSQCSTAADIGCDHGKLGVWLLQNMRAKKVIACDISQKSLNKARRLAAITGLAAQLETREGDGLLPLKLGEVGCVFIMGMGGGTIISILEDGGKTALKADAIIMQPMSDVPKLRLWLNRNGFKIERERIIEEDGRFYNIIGAAAGEESEYTEAEFFMGRRLIESGEPAFKKWLAKKIEETEGILDTIIAETKKGKSAKKYLRDRKKYLEEVFSWLNAKS
ncbi:MAG: tRNA (adenine(22)-N(1))-methyltransferase [Christensenellales bacterium]|jgi:tRNA (adenine22-N1)-methyltransferase